MKKLLLIYGGKSAEHEVSITSANSLLKGFNSSKFEIIPLKISQNGEWCLPSDSKLDIRQELHEKLSFPNIEKTQILNYLKKEIDVVFPLLHGTYGEDGTIQGFFEILGKNHILVPEFWVVRSEWIKTSPKLF